MTTIAINGTVSVSEDCGGCSGGAADTTIEFGDACASISAPVHTGLAKRSVATPAPGWAALSGVGAGDTVTRGQFIFLKVNAPVLVRLTYDDGVGGDVLVVLPVDALAPLILCLQGAKFLKGVEVQGSCTVHYLVSGQS